MHKLNFRTARRPTKMPVQLSPQHQEIYLQYLSAKEKQSPSEVPFKYLYEARKHLYKLKNELEKEEESGSNYSKEQQRLLLAVFDYLLGINHIDSEELSPGEKALTASLEVLRPHAVQPLYCSIVLNTLNQLGILWANWSDARRAATFLEKAEELYHAYAKAVKEPPVPNPFDVAITLTPTECWDELDNLHTHSLYYLAQVYGSLGLKDKSAEYCRMTLMRQLGRKDLNQLTWALDCMTLSQYYTSIGAFPFAHHCLTAAESMLWSMSGDGVSLDSTEQARSFQRAKADLSWIWGKFYLNALEVSAERHVESDTTIESSLSMSLCGMPLFDIQRPATQPVRPVVPSAFAQSYTEAQPLFLEGLRCLEEAKKFFVIDGFVTDHVGIVKDMSQLYKHLGAFESDPVRRSALTQRCALLLTPLLESLNPAHFLDLVQSVTYELSTTYEALVDSRLAVFENVAEGLPYKERIEKAIDINKLIEKTIQYSTAFITLYADPQTKLLPEPFDDADDARAVMTATWRMARLWARKIPVPESEAEADENHLRGLKATYLRNSLVAYTQITAYYTQFGISGFEDEMEVIKAMCDLLPRHISEVEKPVS
ncbi:uncharacterized protein SPPG_07534 [Spizellomyces punctatus DAOM BR117]|uniref:KIF-binding protein n=1 Tax=Spizellomyces punctatus (strain DAOM BR117) TaxID=645134 RepID=A0A0L0H915_SPIPD|nr:uncharacterized protein SPPG_07534 [Spizellomyces punctatus DAOM BR117]KNC97143.1 hypothetical protein SPPG_07534 [Spizellomyces punctatus DAOM BR117]|eukprot:XP_016605183.1 hypothetical protein SPPG_07534 [Spizellomyces punctatus DAOM BR117]